MSKYFAVGQYDTSGDYVPYIEHIRVYKAGDRMVTEDGIKFAVKDEYEDWVSPTMLELGLKSVIKIMEHSDIG